MATKQDKLTIKRCPLCGRSHKYELEVARSEVIYHMTFDASNVSKVSKKEFTRLFTCPISHENFQARISLFETFGVIISDVQVKGLVQEKNSEPDTNREVRSANNRGRRR